MKKTRIGFNELIGKTLEQIDINSDMNEISMTDIDGNKYLMYHIQDCCESVSISDINGDLFDLLASPILVACEVSSEGSADWDNFTWTFYHLATAKGFVVIRWYGSSNGYYSESVDFVKIVE